MQLNHLNLEVRYAEQAAHFFEKYFDFKISLSNPAKTIIALQAGEFDLVLQESPVEPQYPTGMHIGFILSNLQQVRAIFKRLQNDGQPLLSEISASRRGMQFFLLGPGGIKIEVGTHQPTYDEA